MGESRSLPELLEAFGRSLLGGVHTGLPARVLAFDATKCTVDVELQIKAEYSDPDTRERIYEDRPAIGAVPVIWPRGGGYVITLPLAKGDFVWLLFSEQALSEWRTTGQVSEPTDARRHSLGYPYALPGAFPDVLALSSTDAPTRGSTMVLGGDGADAQIVINKGAVPPVIKIGKSATDFVALASLVQTALDAIKTAYNAHKHGGVVPDTLIGTLGPVAATLVKAK